MWKKFVKDYLSFTKKDRVGVIVLVTLIFIVAVLPYLWPERKATPATKEEMEQLKWQAAQLNKTDNLPSPPAKEYATAPYTHPAKENNYNPSATLFYFDPNTLDAAGWQRLGLREKTAATIVKYRSKGGRFRRPEDLAGIYGLHTDEYNRLLPYVRISPQPATGIYDHKKEIPATIAQTVYAPRKVFPAKAIDINTADTAVLATLPGIGSKLAARIINFRDKLGGFYAVQQVGETYGLPDSTFNRVRASLQCNGMVIRQLDLNNADANTLKQHPYIRWALANAIVQYRAQHGNFKSVADLQQLALVTPEVYEKIKPYLMVQ